MHYREFMDIISALSKDEKAYFKPLKKEILNAYHPEIKNEIFQVSVEPDGAYRISYVKLMQEWITQENKLEKFFDDKNWRDYMPFNLYEDYNQWKTMTQS